MNLKLIAIDDEPLALRRLEIALARIDGVELIGTASNGEKALELIRTQPPDLILLDIRMPAMNGFDLLKALQASRLPEIVFVTAYSSYAVQAFDQGAIGYVLKPIDEERLRICIERARVKLRGKDSERRLEEVSAVLAKLQSGGPWLEPEYEQGLWINSGNLIERVSVRDVTWFEAAGDYVAVHRPSKEHLLYDSLRSLVERLDPREFVRVHRKAIVRLAAVEAIERGKLGALILRFADGTRVPVSRSHRAEVLSRVSSGNPARTSRSALFGEREMPTGENQ